ALRQLEERHRVRARVGEVSAGRASPGRPALPRRPVRPSARSATRPQREITICEVLASVMLVGTIGKSTLGAHWLCTFTATLPPGSLLGFHVTVTSTGMPTILFLTKVLMSSAVATWPLADRSEERRVGRARAYGS